ncbi:NAD-dependent epimerase/dehydratase family protein [Kutzneria chonburiensis]|uniref:NAD-dependent epimerase/dehydratase family protein n=1 Tax=Kutzneria chonburiensis TaxID=1483604 RepID=A0ABV6MXI2_9PSEU|nr:NAD-dependent epimerase/dehydratase family protein [Kutzneria chonburiensis]
MRLLVLGGTVFVGHAVAAEALRRGHEVVCAARGTSGGVPPGATLVPVERDAPDGLAALAGEPFDAVVDVAKISYPWVRDAVRTLGPTAPHWTFVSTISVYADLTEVTDRLLEPLPEDGRDDLSKYGGIKVASEQEVSEHLGDRAFIVRPGLITGPGDGSDRFGYWPGRFARGGQVLVPADEGELSQHIDVRDLADWIVTASENRLVGTHDAIGPSRPLADVLDWIRELVAPAGTEVVLASSKQLADNDIQPWSGPRSLPLWLPAEDVAYTSRDTAGPVAAGLTFRPFEDQVRGALATEEKLGLDRERKAGLTLAQEREVLDKLQA